MVQFPIQLGSGLLESVGQLAAVAGTVVLLLILVGLGAFAYKSVVGEGVLRVAGGDAEPVRAEI